jgi:hypothetical protein
VIYNKLFKIHKLNLNAIRTLIMPLIIIISCSENQNHIESEDEVRFSDLEGILTNQCYRCHSESQYSFYGLNLDTYENTMAGSIHGSVVVPYSPEESLLYLKCTDAPMSGDRMPNDNPNFFVNKPEKLQLLYDWIQDGCLE